MTPRQVCEHSIGHCIWRTCLCGRHHLPVGMRTGSWAPHRHLPNQQPCNVMSGHILYCRNLLATGRSLSPVDPPCAGSPGRRPAAAFRPGCRHRVQVRSGAPGAAVTLRCSMSERRIESRGGSTLVWCRRGPYLAAVRDVAAALGAGAVFYSRRYEPAMQVSGAFAQQWGAACAT